MKLNVISVDIEYWYTTSFLRDYVANDAKLPIIEQSTYPILDLFDRKNIKATFFIIGGLAKNHPNLIKDIHERGHELASHGYSHTELWKLTKEQFREDIKRTNNYLEDISGKKVKGFRAPFASLNEKTAWAIDILEEEGFIYDSSIFPMRTPLYGLSEAPLGEYRISSQSLSQNDSNAKIIEIPFTVFKKGIIKIPCTGGIYGRFMPLFLLKSFLKNIEKERPINFYFHPWEIDNQIPKIRTPIFNRLVSQYNKSSYLSKIEAIIDQHHFTSFENFLNIN